MSIMNKFLKKDIYLQKKGKKIIDRLRLKQYKNRISKSSQQNNSETVANEIPKKRYISQEERQKIIDSLRSIIIV